MKHNSHDALALTLLTIGATVAVAGVVATADPAGAQWNNRIVVALLSAGGCLALVGTLLYFGSPRLDLGRGARARKRRAREILQDAPISYRGNDWGQVPLWTVDLEAILNQTIDVHAYTDGEVRRDPAVLEIVMRRLEHDADIV